MNCVRTMNPNINSDSLISIRFTMLSTTTCQVSNCSNSQFTYCPHCSLHICLNCLNEHYFLLQKLYKDDLFNFQVQFHLNRQQTIEQEKQISQQLFENRLNQYEKLEKFLSKKIDQNGNVNISHFQLIDYLELKQNYNLLSETHQKCHQLFNQMNQLLIDFRDSTYDSEINSSSDILSSSKVKTGQVISTTKPQSVLTVEQDKNVSFVEPKLMNNPKVLNEAHVTTSNNPVMSLVKNPSMKTDRRPFYLARELKSILLPCPLINYKLGLQIHHYQTPGLANIPCRGSEDRNLCLFQHLNQHHVFNMCTSLKIIRAIISSPDHLDEIDLFSHASLESIVGSRILSYIGHCPLSQKDVYGILPEHRVRLCANEHWKKFRLHNHMRSIHRISYRYASRLVQAILEDVDEKTPIIRPNESILRGS